ncbi:DNA modification methylase [Rhodococcus hoagii]|nr:DNA modification methylase [Prescottella equi]
MTLPVHRWFRYSAGFSAGWAESVIRELAAERVIDPFAGSGTTLLAAQSCGAESIGVDVHPFVARVASAKLLWPADRDEFRSRAREVLNAARARQVDLAEVAPLTAKVFPPDTLQRLISLRDTISEMQMGDEFDELLWLALVAILRRCSPVGTAQWQYVLPNKTKARVAEVEQAFTDQVDAMCSDMQARDELLPKPASAVFTESDIRTTDAVPAGWADLVLTSPPYANNFDYADATRLEMTFLGEVSGWGDLRPLRNKLVRSCSQQMVKYDATEVLESAAEVEPFRAELQKTYAELDAVRMTKGGRKAYHSMIVAYFHDMGKTWTKLREMTKPGSTVCFVVGDSAPYGVHVPVDRWLGEQAVAAGFKDFEFEKVRDRNIKWENRKHRVPLHEGRLWVRG